MKCTSLLLTVLILTCQFLFNLANIVFGTVTFLVPVCCQYCSVFCIVRAVCFLEDD